MRDPSIHIKLSDLEKLMSKKEARTLLTRASKFSIRNRVMVTAKAASRKKAMRVIQIKDDVVEAFNRVYSAFNIEHDIKAMPIYKNSPQYLTLKEVAQQAVDFCTLYGLKAESGFSKYLHIGKAILDRKYSIYALKSAPDRIAARYGNILTIDNDPNKENTAKFYKLWISVMTTHLGNPPQEIKNPDQYVHFVLGCAEAIKAGADLADWINAQFDRWAFLNSVPELSQFYGPNSTLAYDKYMSKVGKEFVSKEEKEYFDIVKTKKDIPLKNKSRRGEKVHKKETKSNTDIPEGA